MTISKTIERVANICILKKLSVFGLYNTYMNIQRFNIRLRKKRTTIFLFESLRVFLLFKMGNVKKEDIEEE